MSLGVNEQGAYLAMPAPRARAAVFDWRHVAAHVHLRKSAQPPLRRISRKAVANLPAKMAAQ